MEKLEIEDMSQKTSTDVSKIKILTQNKGEGLAREANRPSNNNFEAGWWTTYQIIIQNFDYIICLYYEKAFW